MIRHHEKYDRYKNSVQPIFWLFSFIFIIFQVRLVAQSAGGNYFFVALKSAILNFFFAVAVYVNLKLLIPRLLKAKQYVFYTFWLTLTLFTTAFLIQISFLYPFNFLFEKGSYFDQFDPAVFSSFFFASLIYVAVTSFGKFVTDWLQLQDMSLRYNKIEKEKLEAELNTLKAQINPHFLFNSLNNIYSLALSNSKETPRYILLLSELMRHVLYESRENYIPLEREIRFVENFIELQRLRINKNVNLKFEIAGTIPNRHIAPLLFEPFIDNAFKHGLRSPADQPFVYIRFTFTEDELKFEAKNNFAEKLNPGTDAHGIGLKNVEKRLKLLYKQKDYNLVIHKEEHVFSVLLELKLTSHNNTKNS